MSSSRPASSFAYASELSVAENESRNAPTSSCRTCSASSSGPGPASSANELARPDLLGVDLPQRRPLGPARELPLGRVRRRDGEERRGADLLGDGQDPLDELLEPRPRREGLAGR